MVIKVNKDAYESLYKAFIPSEVARDMVGKTFQVHARRYFLGFYIKYPSGFQLSHQDPTTVWWVPEEACKILTINNRYIYMTSKKDREILEEEDKKTWDARYSQGLTHIPKPL